MPHGNINFLNLRVFWYVGRVNVWGENIWDRKLANIPRHSCVSGVWFIFSFLSLLLTYHFLHHWTWLDLITLQGWVPGYCPLEAFMASWLMAVTLMNPYCWLPFFASLSLLRPWSKHLWVGPPQGVDIAVGNWNCFRVVWPGILILIPSRWALLNPEIFSKSYLLFSCVCFGKAWSLKQFFFGYLPSFPYWRQFFTLPMTLLNT